MGMGESKGTNEFDMNMTDTPMKSPLCCLFGCLCAPCAAFYTRKTVNEHYQQEYSCCQGLVCGKYMQKVPGQGLFNGMLCMCIESFCCPGFSMSVNRMEVMQKENIMPDPCDGHLITASNACQCLALICEYVADSETADSVRCLADLVTYSVLGCMNAQTLNELEKRQAPYPAVKAVTATS